MSNSDNKKSSSNKRKKTSPAKKNAQKKNTRANTSKKVTASKKRTKTASAKKKASAQTKKSTAKKSAPKKTAKRKHVPAGGLSGYTYASAIKKKDFPKRKTVSKRGKRTDNSAFIKLRIGVVVICSVFCAFFLVRAVLSSFTGSGRERLPEKKKVEKKITVPVIKGKKIKKSPEVKSPLKKSGPYIVFVLDDIGYTRKYESSLISLDDNVTYAVLPLVSYSGYFSRLADSTGAELILHLPIESIKGNEPDPGILRPDMGTKEIVSQLYEDMESVPNILGINNHKGSLGTTDSRLMRIVLARIRSENMFFLDSYTNPDSVAAGLCLEMGVPYLRRDVFLDNDNDPVSIRRQINKLVAAADKKGYAIGIGHYRPNTLKVLNSVIPELERKGYRMTSLKRLLDQKGGYRGR